MYTHIDKILNYVFLGNTLQRYLITICILVLGMLIIKLIVRRVVSRLKALAQKTIPIFDYFLVTLLEKVVLPLFYMLVIFLALKSLAFPEAIGRTFSYIILGVIVFFAVKTLIAFIGYGFMVYSRKQKGDPQLEKSLQGIMVIIRIAIWAGAVIFFLDNLGFKISAVIAGLGIGGVAVALAAQTILKDLFSYFCILFDHPFKVGDFIIVGDFMGTIEHVGMKTTRIRSLGGEILVFSNSDLTDSRLRNYKLMEKRRVVFKIRVEYQTSLSQLREIPKIIKNIISGNKEAIFDRAHFFSYGDFSLIFEIVYYVVGGDYNKYMDIQQEINFLIKEEFEKRGIEFAYPTQTIYLPKNTS
ncbi:MAG: mechanosensitive ion channel family protein [Candidatus Omnitrophica bacterium]|nr:mechanosensitive ion channel family protein [Candidatus Omnitrophota bacterium]MDD3988358.1 mechanosensitive ion channel family protein [Candidatus Omnitrophota bacterium]MDD4981477.1 mechanosensitive ion channel family protein [Candidatus Omnitrophota bacterium]